MFYVGIDIAKNGHEFGILDDSGEPVGSPQKVPNTTAGARKMLDAFRKPGIGSDNAVIGMEATGHYWLAFYSHLVGLGFDVKVLNPILTDAYRNMTVRKVKTDSVDALIIARVLRLGEYKESPAVEGGMLALRQLCRFRTYQVSLCSDLKNKSIALLDQIFPEYANLFCDTFGVTSREVLLNYTTPEELSRISTRKLSNLLDKASNGHLGIEKAKEIKNAASSSIGITVAVDAFVFQLRQMLDQIAFIEDHIADLDREIAVYMERSETHITTIPGVGAILGAIILSEIGGISRFENGSKLVAYAGIDASVSQSGNFEGTQMHMSKRGSPYLRRALYLAANIASFKDPELSAYYHRLKARGKHHNVAVCAVARKLCYIVFAVLSEQRPYEQRVQSVDMGLSTVSS